MKFSAIFSLALAACASPTVKAPLDYQVSEGRGPDNFKVTRAHSQEISADKLRTELVVVVGNECARRGFKYFDVADFENGSAEGFCFQNDTRKALAVSFTPDVVSNGQAVVKN